VQCQFETVFIVTVCPHELNSIVLVYTQTVISIQGNRSIGFTIDQ